MWGQVPGVCCQQLLASGVLLQSIPSIWPYHRISSGNTISSLLLTREKQGSAVTRWVQLCVQTQHSFTCVLGGTQICILCPSHYWKEFALCSQCVGLLELWPWDIQFRATWQWEKMNTIYRRVLVRPRASAKQRSRCSWHQWWRCGGRRGEQRSCPEAPD